MATDLLDRILQEIRERKQASRYAYEESQRLERALAALGAQEDGQTRLHESPRRQARSSTARRRHRAAPGANRQAILAVVQERTGVTASEIAATTGIARATVGSTVARLVASGRLERVELPGGGVGFRIPEQESPAGADKASGEA